jgi:glycosyltransferase involved in cell wall biosynthesis
MPRFSILSGKVANARILEKRNWLQMNPGRIKISWLPAAPVEGWASMDRYWRELQKLAEQDPVPGTEILTAIPQGPPSVTQRECCSKRLITKYIIYPHKVQRMPRVDLVHLLDQSYAHLLSSIRWRSPIVATVFDLVPLRDSTGLTPGQVRRFRSAVQKLGKASRIIAVSNQTADDLVSLLGLDRTIIRIIYPGTDLETFRKPVQDARSRSLVPDGKKIILSLGSVQRRKNLESLPDVFRLLQADFRQGKWIFVRCGEFLPPQLDQEIREVVGSQNFFQLGHRYGEEVVSLFQAASVFVLPSTLEGFSFTMMEAMAAGVPVVANCASTNTEVGQEAVAYYPAGDRWEAANVIRKILEDADYAGRLRAAGLRRVGQLSWRNHWLGVKAVYEELLVLRII